jgi:hypothetical protein
MMSEWIPGGTISKAEINKEIALVEEGLRRSNTRLSAPKEVQCSRCSKWPGRPFSAPPCLECQGGNRTPFPLSEFE